MTLPGHALRHLASLGVAIQRHFGVPRDMEWAWANGKPFILQARPITALPELLPPANQLQGMIASSFGEMLPVRPYPLDMATWIPALASAIEPVFALLGLEWSFHRMFEQEDAVVIRFSGRLPRPTWRTLLAPMRLAVLIWRYDPINWKSDPLIADAQALGRNLESRQVSMSTWQELLAIVQEAIEIPALAGGQVRRRYFPRAALSLVLVRLMLAIMGSGNQLGTLLSGSQNMTLESNQALERLSERVRSNPDLAAIFATHAGRALWSALEAQPDGRAFLVGLRAFLDRYGHRESSIGTALEPTWKDAPEVVLGIVKTFAAHPSPLQSAESAWQVARDALLQHRLLRIAPLRSAFLEILAWACTLLPTRQDTHYNATLALPLFRRTELEMGRRLVNAGVLDAPEDVFQFTLAELERTDGTP